MYELVAWLVDNLFQLFIMAMLLRAVLDLVRSLAPTFTPRGFILWLAGIAYLLSDWVTWPVRKVVKPIRLGSVVIDLAWTITMVLLYILQSALANVIYVIFHYVG